MNVILTALATFNCIFAIVVHLLLVCCTRGIEHLRVSHTIEVVPWLLVQANARLFFPLLIWLGSPVEQANGRTLITLIFIRCASLER